MKHKIYYFALLLSLMLFFSACTEQTPETIPSVTENTQGSLTDPVAESSSVEASDILTTAASEEETVTEPGSSSPEALKLDLEFTSKTCNVYEEYSFVYRLTTCNQTEYKGNTYGFEPSIEEAGCVEFILAQEELLEELKAEGQYTFFLSESYMSRSESQKSRGFFLLESLRSWEQVLVTLQTLEGDSANYGYLYAKANAIAEKLGWRVDAVQEAEAADMESVFQEDPGRLNLFLPCFLEKYSTLKQMEAAKSLSIKLYSQMSGEGEEAFLAQAKEYAEMIGIDFTPTYLEFRVGGIDYPLIIETKFVREWMAADYVVDYSEYYAESVSKQELQDKQRWMRNMSLLIYIYELSDSEIYHAREAFRQLNHKAADMKDIFIKPYERVKHGGVYKPLTDDIEVTSPYAVSHEYVHYLSWNIEPSISSLTQSWMREAVACYYDLSSNILQEVVLYGYEGQSIDEYYAVTVSTVHRICDEGTSYNKQLTTGNGKWYASKSTMAYYLSETYSEEVFLEVMHFPERSQELLGLSMDELIENWELWLEEQR